MAKTERGNRILRSLDRYCGIPVVFALGLLRRHRTLPHKVYRIGLLMFGAIGDSLLASAVTADLRRHYPDVRIVGFLTQTNYGLAEILTDIDEFVCVPVSSPFQALRAVRAHKNDIIIDFMPWARISAALTALARAKFTVGFQTRGQYRHYAYDACGEHRADRHELENFRGLLRRLNINAVGVPRLNASLIDHRGSPLAHQRYVIFHPWAAGYRHQLREWALANWSWLGRALVAEGYLVVITGGSADREKSWRLAAEIGEGVEVLAGNATLPQVVSALAGSTAVVSVNTGIMHIAATLGVPLVALHGPTNPLRWGPLSPSAIVLGPGVEEGGAYLNLGFEYPPSPPDCMAKITPQHVLATLKTLLAAKTASSAQPV